MVRNHATPRMEVMYEENYPRYNCVDNVNNLKRSNLSLDLNCGPQAKRTKFMNVANTPLLSSPDYKKLNINTPEIERMLLAQNGLSTPTPGLGMYPTKPVSLEVENFTRGFEEALHELQHSDSSQGGHPQVELPRSSSSSNSSATYVTLDSQYGPFAVKEEPQTVPMGHSPPVSPIDMEHQERYKLERKRERNRVAASKCRRRKLERIARLEDKVKVLKGENSELSTVVAKLKEQVCLLKEQVMEHVNSGCDILPPLNQQQLITGL